MKRLIRIVFLFFCFLSPQLFASHFSGTWVLVSGEYKDSTGRLVPYKELALSSVKVISGNYFSFVTMSGDKFWSSGAGRYSFDDKNYIEIPSHTSFNVKEGSEFLFQYQLKNNIWQNSRWENGERVEYEVWRKVD